ncbi:MAG: hypothetical protein ACRCYS_19240, partial [Beijerinckiaceae bacterium]
QQSPHDPSQWIIGYDGGYETGPGCGPEPGQYMRVSGICTEEEARLMTSAPTLLADNARLRELLDELVGMARTVDQHGNATLERARTALAHKGNGRG